MYVWCRNILISSCLRWSINGMFSRIPTKISFLYSRLVVLYSEFVWFPPCIQDRPVCIMSHVELWLLRISLKENIAFGVFDIYKTITNLLTWSTELCIGIILYKIYSMTSCIISVSVECCNLAPVWFPALLRASLPEMRFTDRANPPTVPCGFHSYIWTNCLMKIRRVEIFIHRC